MIALDVREVRRHEDRVRRLAKAQGLALVKSRCRTPGSWIYQTYGLVDPYLNCYVAHHAEGGYGMSLGEVMAWLAG